MFGGGQPKRTVSVLIGPGDGRKPTGKPPPSHWESGKPCAGVAVGCIQLCGLLTVSSNCPLTPRSLLRADDGLELGTLTLWQAWRSGPPGGGGFSHARLARFHHHHGLRLCSRVSSQQLQQHLHIANRYFEEFQTKP